MHAARCRRVQSQVELVVPTELEARLGEGVVPLLGVRMALGEVSGMGRDAVGDDACLDVLTVRQAQVLLGRDVAQHCRAHSANVGGTDSTRDVVIAGSNIRGEGSQCVEGRLGAPIQLVLHVHGNLVQRHMARALVHDLYVPLPGASSKFPLHPQLRELRLVVGVADAARAQAVPDAQGDVVLVADLQDFVPVLVSKVFLV
mmetsp:Transcript_3680/g.11576  ORF Transcript_3680/g.11576 Transcript_3680/m.11576 type:complete len:201 (+) Transcript_3680:480-1082(+)